MSRIHIAIMRKSWGLTQKILSGEKIIESRWYKNKYRPWDQIGAGETIYFKDSGQPVTLKAEVAKVLQFTKLTPPKVREILNQYGNQDGITPGEIETYYQMFKNKNYCLLIFLNNPQKVNPFLINKTGFGAMSSWLIVPSLSKIKT